MILCCYECKERHVGCHSNCAIYLNAKEQHEKEKSELRAKKEFMNKANEIYYNGFERMKKNRPTNIKKCRPK